MESFDKTMVEHLLLRKSLRAEQKALEEAVTVRRIHLKVWVSIIRIWKGTKQTITPYPPEKGWKPSRCRKVCLDHPHLPAPRARSSGSYLRVVDTRRGHSTSLRGRSVGGTRRVRGSVPLASGPMSVWSCCLACTSRADLPGINHP